ncbi:MAG: M48 family metallopeptidase [Candidatus Cloacimonetes bacterium]|nr:M48 family metallopeptidase [Candidatus Cloacimonadota bacterium]MCF7815344.1 M48 family metallopeptidase [Candidatus Cloacimonadota bacterium]MCF7867759.1 M48 family metallopeptidase [Candidatus Cloacimonadota bacterium]MCF7883155.1 M48 family metallopeptidase [Candidatus Cloacimonadota bacterium]
MKKTEIINFTGIGNVDFVPRKRAKRIRITLKPFKGIRVSVPFGISLKTAQKFVLSKQDWILQKQTEIAEYETEINRSQIENEPIDKKAACDHLYNRLIDLAQKHNFEFNRVTFRQQKTRWGSCSPKNNLNLNIRLFKLPQELQDYVILHELVHTKIKNHSPKFWQELEKVLPRAKKLNKQLKQYKILAL